MRGVKFDTIVAAIRKAGGSWCDETLLDRFAALPRSKGVPVAKKLEPYLETLSETLSAEMSGTVARTLAGSLVLLRVVGELDQQLREQFVGTGARQSTEFELTALHGGLLAARMLWIETLREIVLVDRAMPPELRAAAVEEVTADVVRRYAAAARGVLLHERAVSGTTVSGTTVFGAAVDSSLEVVSRFLRHGTDSFQSRTDRICDGMGIS